MVRIKSEKLPAFFYKSYLFNSYIYQEAKAQKIDFQWIKEIRVHLKQ